MDLILGNVILKYFWKFSLGVQMNVLENYFEKINFYLNVETYVCYEFKVPVLTCKFYKIICFPLI
jgi:hypothetical protein